MLGLGVVSVVGRLGVVRLVRVMDSRLGRVRTRRVALHLALALDGHVGGRGSHKGSSRDNLAEVHCERWINKAQE